MSSALTQVTDSDLKRRITIFLSQKGVSSERRLNIEVADYHEVRIGDSDVLCKDVS